MVLVYNRHDIIIIGIRHEYYDFVQLFSGVVVCMCACPTEALAAKQYDISGGFVYIYEYIFGNGAHKFRFISTINENS